MAKLNKIYTRTGDDGSTGLGTGERRAKNDLRVEAFGTVDEANAAIGLALSAMTGDSPTSKQLIEILTRLQNDLFDLGADLCVPESNEPLPYTPLRMVDAQVNRLETEIDALNANLPALTSFILPGGSVAASGLHMARTIIRRAERQMVALSQVKGEIVGKPAMQFVNRASDLLFVAARAYTAEGAGDVLWVAGQNR
jgi:cob(I)alamin adenosyltransferase